MDRKMGVKRRNANRNRSVPSRERAVLHEILRSLRGLPPVLTEQYRTDMTPQA